MDAGGEVEYVRTNGRVGQIIDVAGLNEIKNLLGGSRDLSEVRPLTARTRFRRRGKCDVSRLEGRFCSERDSAMPLQKLFIDSWK